jgi:hypothetical protein
MSTVRQQTVRLGRPASFPSCKQAFASDGHTAGRYADLSKKTKWCGFAEPRNQSAIYAQCMRSSSANDTIQFEDTCNLCAKAMHIVHRAALALLSAKCSLMMLPAMLELIARIAHQFQVFLQSQNVAIVFDADEQRPAIRVEEGCQTFQDAVT